ncbi:hypothetical protein C8R43DRAFT_1125308 [Mycena crocata]|nr:hypothetical protein C8R43DRAFT_1125308 [Mycena crocata]
MDPTTAHEAFSFSHCDIDDPMPALPLEITDHIIDMVALQRAKRVRRILAACSLVCRAWTHRSRFHFFRDCRLLIHEYNADAFGQSLRSPYCTILPHVRQLTMRSPTNFDRIKEELKLLTHVESLKLSGPSWAAHGAAPRRGFMSSLTNVVELEIDCAHLGDFDHALLIICAFPRLDRLSLRRFSLLSRSEEESRYHSVLFPPYLPYSPPAWIRPNESFLRPPPLSTLSVSAPAIIPVLHWLNWTRTHSVTRLELHFCPALTLEDTPPLIQYLEGLRDSLKHLKLSGGCSDGANSPQVFHLGNFKNLRTVHFEHLLPTDMGSFERHVVSIVRTITSLYLEGVGFTFDTYSRSFRRIAWRNLDAFLVESHFPNLKFVRFSMPVIGVGELESDIKQLLPRIHAQGLLQIRSIPDVEHPPSPNLEEIEVEILAYISEFLMPV